MRPLIATLLLALLAGCGGRPYVTTGVGVVFTQAQPIETQPLATDTTAPTTQQATPETSDNLMAEHALDRAQQHLNQYELTAAKNLLDHTPLPDDDVGPQRQKALLTAQWMLLNRHPSAALRALKQLDIPHRPQQHIIYRKTLANAYSQLGQTLDSAVQRIFLAEQFENEAPNRARWQEEKLWSLLQRTSENSLRNRLSRTQDARTRGWIALALITKQTQNVPTFIDALQRWQNAFPEHPANRFLPEEMPSDNNAPALQHIALLLPLHGPLGKTGQAIQNGFLTAYYQEKTTGKTVPKLQLIDTTYDNIVDHYNAAVSSGAQFIIGPLTKENIDTLSTTNTLPVPTLALNSRSEEQDGPVKNLYEFGLSPIDEAVQAANHAYEMGYRRAAIITTPGQWGRNIAQTFQDQWKALGGETVAEVNASEQMNQDIATMLNVHQSQARSTALRRSLGRRFRSLPRRRQDIDVIFLIAHPSEARFIRPLLRFYYAGNIPIYATSTLYTGGSSARRNKDLNGIHFASTAWTLQDTTHLKNPALIQNLAQIQTLWPTQSITHINLYGLGVDAYHLMTHLAHLQAFPHIAVNGAMGQLVLTPSQHIARYQDWAAMRHGQPRLEGVIR